MREESNGGFLSGIIKGIGLAVIITLAGVLLFAFIIKLACLSSGVIKAVNQFIKILSVFLACIFSVKGGKGLIKGAVIGLISTLITYLIFALMGSGVSFNGGFILDLVFGLIIGAISGIISVNLKKD